jgi:hypothetical protein
MVLSKPLVLVGTALAATAFGFRKPFHFIGTGYGLSMTALSAVSAFMFRKSATAPAGLHALGVAL